MTAPLPDLVERRAEDVADGAFEGAGVVSSWADVVEAHRSGAGAPALAADYAGAALDTLGVVMNPLQGMAGAGIGWLIEHVRFLHEPLDALAGDPIQVGDQARTWANVAGELRAIANDHRSGLGRVGQWQGAAGDAHRAAIDGFAGRLDEAASNADRAASQVLLSGVGVATVRSLIRDLITDFVADAVVRAALALAGSLVTVGASVAAFVAATVVSAARLATAFTRRIGALLTRLGADASALAAVIGRMEDLSAGLARRADALVAASDAVRDGAWQAGASSADVVDAVFAPPVELAKQATDGAWQPGPGESRRAPDWHRKVAEEAGR